MSFGRETRTGIALAILALAGLTAPVGRGPAAQGPSFRLPPPTGAFSVGTTGFVVESTEPSPGPGSASRWIAVTVWYPAADTIGRERARYLREEDALRVMAAAGRNPATAALRQRDVVTHSWLSAPPIERPNGLPVLVFSPGYLAMPSDYTALMEDLASQGFAIFSLAHPGETMAVSLPGGRVEAIFDRDNRLRPVPAQVLAEWAPEDSIAAVVAANPDPRRADAALRWYLGRIPRSTAALARWVADTRAVVDQVERLAARTSESAFAGRLDLSRLGAFGHSMGGVAAAAFCARDSRCRAAVNLDGSPQYGDLIDRPSARPLLMVYSDRPGRVGVNDPIYRQGVEYWRAVLRGSLHLNFGDWQYWSGPDRIEQALGAIAPERATEIVDRLVREFFAAELGTAPSRLLAGDSSYPELEVGRVR